MKLIGHSQRVLILFTSLTTVVMFSVGSHFLGVPFIPYIQVISQEDWPWWLQVSSFTGRNWMLDIHFFISESLENIMAFFRISIYSSLADTYLMGNNGFWIITATAYPVFIMLTGTVLSDCVLSFSLQQLWDVDNISILLVGWIQEKLSNLLNMAWHINGRIRTWSQGYNKVSFFLVSFLKL